MIVNLKIDVTKIDKDRLYKGKSGTYLDAIVFLKDETDQYGNNGMITQSVSKEEREAGVRGSILGNAKILGESKPKEQVTVKQVQQVIDPDDGDLLPF
jgi:hypothetical protein